MDIQASGSGEPGPNGEKPQSMWMANDSLSIICPFCDVEKQSDDSLGSHLVHEHWQEINFATKRVRDMNARQN